MSCAITVLRVTQFGGPDAWFWACATCSKMSAPFAREKDCGGAAIHHGTEAHGCTGVIESVVPSGFRGVVG